jgi:hypothetical protein
MKNQIIKLFEIVDNQKWDQLNYIFHPLIIYERPGFDKLNGIDEVVNFYKKDRKIISGKHIFLSIMEDKSKFVCWGRFVGIDKNNFAIDIEFVDLYTFDKELIQFRKTFFYTPLI